MKSKRSEVIGNRSVTGLRLLGESGSGGDAFAGEIDFIRERVSAEGEVLTTLMPQWWTKEDTLFAVISLNPDAYTPGCDGCCDWCAEFSSAACNGMRKCRVCSEWASPDGVTGVCQDPAYYGTRAKKTHAYFSCEVFNSNALDYETANRFLRRKPLAPSVKEAFNADDLCEFVEVVKRLLQLGVITLKGARKDRKEAGL